MDADLLRAALAQMPAFLSLFTTDGKIHWYSRASYGLTRDCLIGQPSDTIIVEEDRPAWWAAFRRALNLETCPYSVRVRVPLQPGEVRLSGWLSPVVLDGEVRYVACCCRDEGQATAHAPPPPDQQLVTLNQIAAIAHRRKKSLRRYVAAMPPPVTPGRRGHAARWRWADVRAWVERTFGLPVPERFPSLE